jgi:hypothetical protein
LEDVGSDAKSQIESQAGRLTEWLGDRVVIPRFPSSSDREISGR